MNHVVKISVLIGIGLIVACTQPRIIPNDGVPGSQNNSTRAVDPFQIYLLMGQSNMAGRDLRPLESQMDDPRILAWDYEGNWVMARDPIHKKTGRTEPGIGPGIPFAREMLKSDPESTIGLVPCAIGGSPLRRWVKGGDLYEEALERARMAGRGGGVIRGVLWHQGESDTTSLENAGTYEARLTQMIQDLRADLGDPELPVVVGQLGEFLDLEKQPYVETVRAAIRNVAHKDDHIGYASSDGLGHKGDSLHFSGDGAVELGKRYAEAMQVILNAQQKD